MKAALCKSLDGPAGIVIEDIAEPQPGPGEALIAVKAAALNFFDTLITRGKYQAKPELPFSPSGEVAGVVEAVGAGVDGRRRGRPRAGLPRLGRRAREDRGAGCDAGAHSRWGQQTWSPRASSVTYGTAIHGLKDRGASPAGESVAVLGASGGAGLAAVEIAKLMGARVIAVASSADKLEVCRQHGADDALELPRDGSQSGPARADRRPRRRRRLRLRRRRRLGAGAARARLAGAVPRRRLRLRRDPDDPAQSAAAERRRRGRRVLGRGGEARPACLPRQHAPVLGWVASGKLDPRIHATYPLADIREAIGVLDRREAVGKVVLTI